MGRILYHPLPTALVLLALLVVAASCGASPGGGARQGEQQPSEDPAASEGVGNPTLGAADAPVEMIEWGDFQ